MDEKQKQLMRMQQYQYAPQLPFYMSYPQNMYMTELEYERDMERMKELYPEDAKQIQRLVEEECDKMEYEGSMMFDEYPDRVMLKAICDRIPFSSYKWNGVGYSFMICCNFSWVANGSFFTFFLLFVYGVW